MPLMHAVKVNIVIVENGGGAEIVKQCVHTPKGIFYIMDY